MQTYEGKLDECRRIKGMQKNDTYKGKVDKCRRIKGMQTNVDV